MDHLVCIITKTLSIVGICTIHIYCIQPSEYLTLLLQPKLQYSAEVDFWIQNFLTHCLPSIKNVAERLIYGSCALLINISPL